MFRTRTPLSLVASYQIPLSLHVLGLPLAFILSQDQTLHCISFLILLNYTLGLYLFTWSFYILISFNDLFSVHKLLPFSFASAKV